MGYGFLGPDPEPKAWQHGWYDPTGKFHELKDIGAAMPVKDHTVGEVDEGLILDLLQSNDLGREALARLLATGVCDTITNWIVEERARGTPHHVINNSIETVGAGICALGMPPIVVMDEYKIKPIAIQLTNYTRRLIERTLRERLKMLKEAVGKNAQNG